MIGSFHDPENPLKGAFTVLSIYLLTFSAPMMQELHACRTIERPQPRFPASSGDGWAASLHPCPLSTGTGGLPGV